MKVLIADDDPLSLLYLQDALQDWGYEVLTATDGIRACEILQQPDAPMLAVIDWMMPGMDGIDVCRQVRETIKDRYVYLIMLTTRSETEFVVEAMNAGADDFVRKPFDAEELQVRIRAGRRISELEQQLRLKATHDALTGVYNRGALLEILDKEWCAMGATRGRCRSSSATSTISSGSTTSTATWPATRCCAKSADASPPCCVPTIRSAVTAARS